MAWWEGGMHLHLQNYYKGCDEICTDIMSVQENCRVRIILVLQLLNMTTTLQEEEREHHTVSKSWYTYLFQTFFKQISLYLMKCKKTTLGSYIYSSASSQNEHRHKYG
jgi:hypothetical protein